MKNKINLISIVINGRKYFRWCGQEKQRLMTAATELNSAWHSKTRGRTEQNILTVKDTNNLPEEKILHKAKRK